MALTNADRELLEQLEREPQELRNVVTDAANAARGELQAAGRPVAFDDRHASLDAAIYRYLRECSRT